VSARAGASGGLLLLSRPDCSLCEEFAAALRAQLGAACPTLEIVEVDERPDLRIRYGRLIPVLLETPSGALVCAAPFDPEAVSRWQARQAGSHARAV
jgi:hypothetical protein